jgi:SAM-dependent methyltransferase
MTIEQKLEVIAEFFREKVEQHGATPAGVDLNSTSAQETRFAQLVKLVDSRDHYSLIDYGCGYGALIDYLDSLGHSFDYAGYDITPAMIDKARELYGNRQGCRFVSDETLLAPVDYVVESGIFNMKLQTGDDDWTGYVVRTLDRMNALALKGFAFNLLTGYSDADRMRPDLYYADPCFFFDLCKKKYAKNVALLHDYGLYDFTILVRKAL